MKHFLKKALGFSSPQAALIRADFSRLNELRKGLGDEAARYVLTGEGETVLSTLTQTGGADKLAVGRGHYSHHDTITPQRWALMTDMSPYDTALVARYGAALAATTGGTLDKIAGTEAVPASLRIITADVFMASLRDVNSWPRKPRTKKAQGLTAANLVPLAEACGGTAADVFDLLFWDTNTWGSATAEHYRKIIDLKALVTAHPKDVLEGVGRLAAHGRETFLKELGKMGLHHDDAFFGFVVEEAGASAKGVREAAQDILLDAPKDKVIAAAAERLAGGTVGMREGMVRLLIGVGTAEARAVLEAHKGQEKSARILSAIDNASVAADLSGATDEGTAGDDARGYVAIDGSRIDIPPRRKIETGPRITLSKDDQAELRKLIEAEQNRVNDYNREQKARKQRWMHPDVPRGMADWITRVMEGNAAKLDWSKNRQAVNFLTTRAADWTRRMLEKMPLDQQLGTCFSAEPHLGRNLNPYWQTAFTAHMQRYLGDADGDLREVEDLAVKLGVKTAFGGYRQRTERAFGPGDMLRNLIPEESYAVVDHELFRPEVLWPYLAENFGVIDEALGLARSDEVKLNRVAAIRYLSVLPRPPQRYFGVLLEAATGAGKLGRAEARAMLGDAKEVRERLIALLDDGRQAVRAGAAEWIAERGDTGAVKAMKARLKKEKSEVARAAILSALKSLGEPLDAYVGPDALLTEAEAGLKKAKFDKLDWLPLDRLPKLAYATGKPVPEAVLRWWIFLANKLKQPGGNGLFEIYLDQLKPEDAAAFSQFILDAWIAYDTKRPSDEENNAYAKDHAADRFKWSVKWIKDLTMEKVFAELVREHGSQYLNSGAAHKGLVGLTTRTKPDVAAAKVQHFLKNHGSRTSQASSLLEMLAAKGDPVSLQVVIAAATRLKQKGVQAFAGELVQKIADDRDWTMDELADRTVPTAGLDDDGVLELPCGAEEKLYTARLTEDLALELLNPDGKVVKALASGDDETTKASKKQLSTSRKELKQVIKMQTARLYEALCAERQWPVADWMRDYRAHPVMRKLTERAVWLALDDKGQVQASFRPTAEGEYIDAEDNDIDPSAHHAVRLAHGAIMRPDHAAAWKGHLRDYEVTALFTQFGRELLYASGEDQEKLQVDDREGWVSDTFTLRGIATKLGYERGEALDGGYFNEYVKTFRSAGVNAVIEFSGNCVPEENLPAAVINLSFGKVEKNRVTPMKLGEVPDVLLSECWNDYHAMAAKGAHDPKWRDKMPW